jgi:hypothetical protein
MESYEGTMTESQLAGTWRLISMTNQPPEGPSTYPFGDAPLGLLMYDSQGHMAVQLMAADRPPFASGDFRRGTDAEVRAAYEGLNCYFGTYTVDEDSHTVVHHVAGASLPNRQGTDLVRRYALDRDRLILSTPPTRMGGELLSNVLVWERVCP